MEHTIILIPEYRSSPLMLYIYIHMHTYTHTLSLSLSLSHSLSLTLSLSLSLSHTLSLTLSLSLSHILIVVIEMLLVSYRASVALNKTRHLLVINISCCLLDLVTTVSCKRSTIPYLTPTDHRTNKSKSFSRYLTHCYLNTLIL